MTTYKEISGKQVKNYSSDPANDAEGQVWYNSTDGAFKSVLATAAWSSGANTISNVYAAGGAGTQTAGLGFGGNTGPANTNATYEYNGTGWSNVPATLGTARSYVSSAAAGTQTATLVVGGEGGSPSPSGKTEEYNGTSWSEQNDMANARDSGLGFGTQTAFINSGGVPGYPWGSPASTSTEFYDGTNWTATPAVNNPRAQGGGFGISTAGLIFGGRTSSPATSPSALLATTESYNGSSWTSENILNTGRLYLSSGSGTLTSGVTAGGIAYPGGTPTVTTTTETYDGTSWTTSPSSLATTRYVGAGGFGSGTSALVFGGRNGGTVYSATEEYNFSATVTTGAAWSSGGNLNTGNRNGAAGAGIQTASIIAGGGYSSPLNNSESYDGSSWTNSPTMGTARGYLAGANAGPSTATVIFGGLTASSPAIVITGVTEEYNGTSWSEQNDLSTARRYHAGFGTQTAAVCAGGDTSPTPRTTAVEEYDGTNWTSGTALPAGAQSWGACGTQTTGLAIGDIPMYGYTYDGSTWTSIPTLNTPGNYTKVFGTQAAAIQAGRNPGKGTLVEEWDGTSWFTQASLATARFNGALTGTSTSGLVAGGEASTATEEFTGTTTALNTKTLTTS